jgi:hypothetical protein
LVEETIMKPDAFIPVTGRPAMAQAAPAAVRDTTPGHQPMAGPPMPSHPAMQAPKGKKQHHRANIMAKSKTKKGKHVIPPATFR